MTGENPESKWWTFYHSPLTCHTPGKIGNCLPAVFGASGAQINDPRPRVHEKDTLVGTPRELKE